MKFTTRHSASPARSPRLSGRGRRWAAIATAHAGLWFAHADLMAAPLCGGRFEQSTQLTTFDGATFDQVRLRSSGVTLLAFTFGAWAPDETHTENGFTLRHVSRPGVTVSICPLTGADVPVDATRWANFVSVAAAQLGPNTTVVSLADSAEKAGVVEVLGWHTQEVLLLAPAAEGVSARAEFHLTVNNRSTGVVFTLAGPPSEVEMTLQDFRFLLSRLSVP